MKPQNPSQPTNTNSQRLIWLIAGGAFLAILSSAVYVIYDEPAPHVFAPPPTNTDGSFAVPSSLEAPTMAVGKGVGQCEVVDLNGQQVVKFRVNAQGDEVVFDSITGKVVFIRTKDGIAPTSDFPMPPIQEAGPQPKMADPTTKTWFQSAPM